MSRRMDVELTSARDDGTWTWRAAGAREPKGVVEQSKLYDGAKVGDVLRAEVEIDVDGITILSVTPPKGKSGGKTDLIEIVGPPREFQGVTASLVPKQERPRRDRRDRPGRPDGERGGERRGGPPGDRRGERPGGDRGRPGGPRGERTDRGGERGERPDRPRGDRRPGGDRERSGEGQGGRPRPKRLNPQNVHRTAVVESLSPEQRPIAEQILRGGIPAVRRAIDEQNTKAKADNLPEIKPEPLLAIAEELLPRLKTAEWRDRAEAAVADVDTIGLRDLRSVVSGGDANARDDETRKLAVTLRESLDRRLKEERDEWIGSITGALEEHRLVRALRVSTRPPDPSMRLPSDLAMRLAGAASEGLSPDSAPDRWAALLEAVVASPVRTTVKPVGLPEQPGDALLNAARQAAGRIPALAQLLGLAIPPPPMATKKGGAPRPRPVPPPPRPQTTPAPPPRAASAAPAPEAVAPVTEPAPATEPVAPVAPVEAETPQAETPQADAPQAEAPAEPAATEGSEQTE